MKKFFFLMAIAILAACQQVPVNEITITGTVNNPTDTMVEVFYYKDMVANQTEKVEVTLDENNQFSATLPLTEGKYIFISHPRRTIRLFLVPGAEVNVQFDAQDPAQVPVIEGKKALESQFLVAYNQEMESKFNRSIILNQLGSTPADEFLANMESAHQEKLSYLEGFEGYNKLDKDFVDLMKTNFKYEKYGLLMEYPMAFAYFNPDAGDPVMPEGYYAFLEEEDLFNDANLSATPYLNFANTFLNKKMEEQADPASDVPYYERQYLAAREAFSGKTRDILVAQSMISMLNFGDFDRARELYADFSELVQAADIKEVVDAEYQKVLALSPGKPAPAFNLTDIDGNPVSLSDFAGQVVYLDFWASWCGPCMREVPFAKELKERMEGYDDLVYLYISVDTDEQAWRNTVAEKEISGVHINVPGFSHDVPDAYNLKGVPTFYLIGRDGNIFDNRPPRPSNPKIDEVLKAALAQEVI
ncbi:MAG: TlpA disulfide reductase family protein [Bacteroides sp.]|nr:TlpA disulfide reductase family protein [Bacteroides sp.]